MPAVAESTMDIAIEALFQCLPASSVEEIRRRLQKELGYRVNTQFAQKVLAHLRKNVATYGYVVAYVPNGTAGAAQDKDRYFAMLVQKDGSFYMDPQHRRHFGGGMQSKLGGAGTILANAAVMIDVMLQYERSANQRDFWEDSLETLNYAVKRVARINKTLKQRNVA